MDKFGSTPLRGSTKVIQTPSVISFTKDGDYNFREHRLCNVKQPAEKSDAVNKEYLDLKTSQSFTDCVKLITQKEEILLKKLAENRQSLEDARTFLSGKIKENNKNLNSFQTELRSIETHAVNSSIEYTNTQVQLLRDAMRTINERHFKLNSTVNALSETTEDQISKIEDTFENKFKTLQNTIPILKQELMEQFKYETDKYDDVLKGYANVLVLTAVEPLKSDIVKEKDLIRSRLDSIEARLNHFNEEFIKDSFKAINTEFAKLEKKLSRMQKILDALPV
jgi:uncharacterized protein YukE